jgi:hypothetical protein
MSWTYSESIREAYRGTLVKLMELRLIAPSAEWLGMSHEEYIAWVQDSRYIWRILEARPGGALAGLVKAQVDPNGENCSQEL